MATGFLPSNQIIHRLARIKKARHDQIRELVLEHRRVDILAEYVLGYSPQPHHREMMAWQESFQEGILLAWRGAAKTIYCTISRAIAEILWDPNVRILFASDAAEQAKTFLRGVKMHLEENQTFRDIFGDYKLGARVWSETEIMVGKRSSFQDKEATITCAGTETTLPGRHYDVIFADDIVTKDNSQTAGQRKKVQEWWYDTLYPTLQQPDGNLWVIGTRWHDEDLYGWLTAEDFKGATLRIPVLDDNDESRWPEMFPTAKMHRIRKGSLSAFELQYMCMSGVLLGGIFTLDHFTYVDDAYPSDLYKWQGVDLAARQKQHSDFFAHATVGISRHTKKPYLFDIYEARIKFPQQLQYIAKTYEQHSDTVRIVIESNAYQVVASQQINESYPHLPVQPRWTHKDKVVRANQLAAIVGEGGIHVRRHHHKFVQHMCSLPNGAHDDMFDAFYLAVIQGLRGARKRRRRKVGLI